MTACHKHKCFLITCHASIKGNLCKPIFTSLCGTDTKTFYSISHLYSCRSQTLFLSLLETLIAYMTRAMMANIKLSLCMPNIRDGPIPVSVSAIKKCCRYAEAALSRSIGIGNIGVSAEVDISISAYRQKCGIGPSLPNIKSWSTASAI